MTYPCPYCQGKGCIPLPELDVRILKTLDQPGAMMSTERVRHELGEKYSTVWKRLNRLEEYGYVESFGEWRSRMWQRTSKEA